MNTNLVEQTTSPADVLEKVVIDGDLSKLSSAERMAYYGQVCQSLGLNPMTRPFEYLRLNGKLTLYAKKDATEQLAQKYGISITLDAGHLMEGIYVMKATARMANREVDATGAVSLDGLKGEAMANALMKAETKACRRAVLRLVGLGWLDETEVAAVPDAVPVAVDPATGEIVLSTLVPSSTGEQASGPTGASQEALVLLNEARKQAGMSADELMAMSTNRFGAGPRDLSAQHLDELTVMVGQSGEETANAD